ncbi:cell wall-binding repeat-containing protein [Kineococcus rubinsiae]|uniref:cell wall-binding repeat-containing protein n=1 Tax=Kineococcus rubinsiae TaxID=2609562 RepID=UPI00143109CF|nr:cell wall-binding repeat-containing protein [Kineococcus rubinsiae]
MTRNHRTARAIGAGAALLVGLGTVAATAAPANAATGFAFDTRVSGNDRYATAVAASKLLSPTDGDTEDVVIVNGTATVDGLTASYLAGLYSAPILYTQANSVPAVTADEITRLGAKNVWIVGGEAQVSAGLEAAWKGAGKTVVRYAGANRYATAAAVAQADETSAPEKVFVASGTSTADALAAGPIAWSRNYPILLTQADSVPAETKAALDSLGTTTRWVLGGTSVVSDATYTSLAGTARLAGANRQETATKIADQALATEFFDTQSAGLVGGAAGASADALAAAPVSGSQGVPILFTDANGSLGATTTAYLTSKKAALVQPGNGWIFGGLTAVPQAAADAATAAVQ